MTQLQNVTLQKAANIYFDGKVTSRTVLLEEGNKVTLGIMLPGEYTFKTDTKELMEITQGTLSYRLVDQDWVE
ncbi:MAG: pyrimidine/purine nucleoside phosphorylase, partial [Lysinibacillus sp.]